MSNQTVNLSATDVLEHLNLTLPARWTSSASELDVVCIDTPANELGWIVTLNMDSFKGNSFTVHEFASDKEFGNDHESDDEFLTYDEVLSHIRDRVDLFVNGPDNI